MGRSSSDKEGSEKLVEVSGRNSYNSMYTVHWKDGHSSKYPFVWLQDNCRCSACYHPSSYQRLALMANLDPEVKPTQEEITEDGSLLKITWPNNHVGEYPSTWLRNHQFDKGNHDPISDLKSKPWGAELADKIPRFKFGDIINNDEVLFDWLRTLHETGLAVLTDAPTKPGAVEAIGKRVAYLRETVYGKKFQVYSKFNTSSLAYTSAELGLHVDLPFYGCCPGVQMLHCIRQTKSTGGDNQFADAFNAALILKKEYPAEYKLLTTVNIYFRNCGTDHVAEYHLIKGRPMFEEDSEGNFKQVYYNDQVRASYLDVPVDKVQDVYRAMKLFHQTLYKHNISIKLRDGEVVTFNNTRVMHGRSGFTVDVSSAEQVRHYEGGYLEWDEIFSRLRVLRENKEGEFRV
ncbi:gamma-butyrobetaine dioxygenase-like [Apostichopus japonicus]|uniref:gamma-butyrobetaine dioxygenase-like n=1 Tax=Stichopus japonicus TaxID=307972 RepID=UPI003AB8B320